jgi:3-keto-disaccharide hydrolase
MKRLALLPVLFALLLPLPAWADCGSCDNVKMPTPEQLQADGYTSLFNGKDLSGWNVPEGDNGHWKVIDGVIDYDACSEAKANKSLYTEEEFGDYTIYFDWRFKRTSGEYPMPTILPDGSYKTDEKGERIITPTANADSGLLFRPGHQANLWCWPCGSGELWMVRNNKSATPEQRAAAVPKACADKPVGEWNRMMAHLVGDRVTIVLNGHKVIDQAKLPGLKEMRGPIGFQHHGGPLSAKKIENLRKRGEEVEDDAMSPASSLIQFRNVFIKPIKP